VKEASFKNGRLIASAKNSTEVNRYLDGMESRLREAIFSLQKDGIRVTPDTLKAKLSGEKQSFWEFFESFTKKFPPEVGPGTQKHYLKQRPLLERFEKKFGRLTFQSFDQRFADELTKFMRDEDYNDSTIEQTFSKIRALLNYAKKYGVISSVADFNTSARAMDTGAVYLNQEEIEKIYAKIQEEHEGEGIPQDLQMYGRIFVLGTQLGVRVSDFKINPDNVITKGEKKYLNLSNQKTTSQVIIPLSKLAIEILEFFEWNVPPFVEQSMNKNIKIICELAKIEDVVIYRAVKGGKMIEKKFYKYERIVTHTMRRSFATNMFKLGVPTPIIMRITGHTVLGNFMKYIRIENQEAADILGGFIT
jgi:integrase